MYQTWLRSKLLKQSASFCRIRGVITNVFSTRNQKGSTIYALSSGYGKCGVAVVRVSGPNAREAVHQMTRIQKLEPRKALLRNIYDPDTGEIIDKGLCLWFPGPKSFTGEDCLEFHVHGGPAVLNALFTSLSKLKFTLALPGEFTRRAFYNNKLDLTETEGLADLIHAETEQQRKQALFQTHGNLSTLYKKWRKILSECLASLEAFIDFAEGENIDNSVLQTCNSSLKELMEIIKSHLKDGRKGEILRNGIRTVIVGEPNVGKSSLLNCLTKRNAAIVTPIAGTTRDIVETVTNISEYPVILADTAGLTITEDIVEQEGIRRARDYAKDSDFVILMSDASKYLKSGKTFNEYTNEYIHSLELNDLLLDSHEENKKFIIVMNKIDEVNEEDAKRLKETEGVIISCKTEEGFQNLMVSMTHCFQLLCGNPSRENPTISQMRYRNHLERCVEHLSNYFNMYSIEGCDMAILTHEVRMAMRELGKITGEISSEEVLDIIFRNFCIGK